MQSDRLMRLTKSYILFLILIASCTSVSQTRYPQPTYLEPNIDNLNIGSDYKNQRWLLDKNGVSAELTTYFNYKDFETWFPIGTLIAEPPYDKEENLNKIPQDKIKTYYEKKIDSALVDMISKTLFEAKEPVLNNFYLNKDIYRFIWNRSFHDDFIIRIWNENNQSYIETVRIKKQDKQTVRTIKRISIKEFNDFKTLVKESKFWILPTYEWDLGTDGSYWIIEAHTNIKYHTLCRWSPSLLYEDDLALRQIGQWMIDKSGLKGEDIY